MLLTPQLDYQLIEHWASPPAQNYVSTPNPALLYPNPPSVCSAADTMLLTPQLDYTLMEHWAPR